MGDSTEATETTRRARLIQRLRRRIAPQPQPPPQLVLLDDDPDDLTDDVFGHADYAAALAKVIAGAPNGLTIGLFGPWGIGKTSVLEALARDCGPGTSVVTFDAWRYRDDAFRREFLRSVAQQLVGLGALRGFDVDRDLRDLDFDVSRPREVFAWTWRRLFPAGIGIGLVVLALLATNGRVVDSTQGAASLVLIFGLVTWATGRLDRLLELRTEIEAQRRIEDADRFSRRFREILGGVRVGRLVVAVDNIDRLDPESAADILSTIKTYLEPAVTQPRRRFVQAIWRKHTPAPLVTFVVAVDDVALRGHLEAIAPQHSTSPRDFADEYLRKYFGVRMTVRPLLDDDLRTFVLRRVEPLVERWTPSPRELPLGQSAQAWVHRQSADLVELVIAGLRANPRRIKQFVNSMEMALTLLAVRRARGLIDDVPLSLGLLGQLVFIEEEFPDRFAALVRNEELLDELHDVAQRSDPAALGLSDDEQARLVPVLRSTYGIPRRSARTYLRLKITDAERELPDREAVLAALRAGDIGEAEARLDPAYAFDDALLAEPVSVRADRARPWAARLEALVREEIRADRIDPAVNLLRAGLEIDVLSFHRAAVAAALGRASSDAKVRAQLWRLDPAGLLDLASELPDITCQQIVDELASSYARNPDVSAQKRADLASALAPFAPQISSGIAAAIRATLAERVGRVRVRAADRGTTRPDHRRKPWERLWTPSTSLQPRAGPTTARRGSAVSRR